MHKNSRNALILWFATAFSIFGFVAGFNVVVDPFGYFGNNTIGYYFSSERQFKLGLVSGGDYNAIVLGDSRIAFVDTSHIRRSDYQFVNGGIGGASVKEQLALLSAARLDRLKLVVFGLTFGDLQSCDDNGPTTNEAGASAPSEYGPWNVLRFTVSLTQLAYSIEALMDRAEGQSPRYHADGTRSIADKAIADARLDAKTERYWEKINRDISQSQGVPHYQLGERCRTLLEKARALSDHYGFELLVVFLPINSDLLKHLALHTKEARQEINDFLAEVRQVIPHVVDLSQSQFSDSRNFWLDDSMHFKPMTGALVVREAIDRSVGAQAKR